MSTLRLLARHLTGLQVVEQFQLMGWRRHVPGKAISVKIIVLRNGFSTSSPQFVKLPRGAIGGFLRVTP